MLNKFFKKTTIILAPALFWVGLTALGFGAQSLSNIIELAIILMLSLLSALIPERFINFKYIVIVLLLVAFLFRLLMPSIPE